MKANLNLKVSKKNAVVELGNNLRGWNQNVNAWKQSINSQAFLTYFKESGCPVDIYKEGAEFIKANLPARINSKGVICEAKKIAANTLEGAQALAGEGVEVVEVKTKDGGVVYRGLYPQCRWTETQFLNMFISAWKNSLKNTTKAAKKATTTKAADFKPLTKKAAAKAEAEADLNALADMYAAQAEA